MKTKLLALFLVGGAVLAEESTADNAIQDGKSHDKAQDMKRKLYGVAGLEAGLRQNIIYSSLNQDGGSSIKDSDRNLGASYGLTAGLEFRSTRSFALSAVGYVGGGGSLSSELTLKAASDASNSSNPVFRTNYSQLELGADLKVAYYTKMAQSLTLVPSLGVSYRHVGYKSFKNTIQEILGGSARGMLPAPKGLKVSSQKLNAIYPVVGLGAQIGESDKIYVDYRFGGVIGYKTDDLKDPVSINGPQTSNYKSRTARIAHNSYVSVGYQHSF